LISIFFFFLVAQSQGPLQRNNYGLIPMVTFDPKSKKKPGGLGAPKIFFWIAR